MTPSTQTSRNLVDDGRTVLAPDLVNGPLPATPRTPPSEEMAMPASGTFTCPACGADFDVRERLGGAREPVAPAGEEPVAAEERPHEDAISFQCAACGADYDTQEALPEEAEVRH